MSLLTSNDPTMVPDTTTMMRITKAMTATAMTTMAKGTTMTVTANMGMTVRDTIKMPKPGKVGT